MQIEQRHVRATTILDVLGTFAVGDDEDLFRTTLRELIGSGRHDLILNMADVSRIDSICIGLMVATHVSLGRRNGSLRLLNLQRRVREQLEIARMDEVFPFYDSEVAAVEGN